jgi:pyruvate,water dikinase
MFKKYFSKRRGIMNLNLNEYDRSVSSLRTLRPSADEDIFWFRDDLHQPYPISPLGMTTIQKHHAWGYHVAAEITRLPGSKGGHVKIYKGRVYLGFEGLTDPEEIRRRAEEFKKLIEYCMTNWDEYYTRHIDEVREGLSFMGSVNDGMSDSDLHSAIRRSEEINMRNWEIHFTLMYPADAIYFEFENFCKQHGLEEKDAVVMLRGLDTMATRTDYALWELSKMAVDSGLSEIILKEDVKSITEKLAENPKATEWLKLFSQFLDLYGHRISAAHLDVIFPTWIEDPSPVLRTIQTYIPKIKEGWNFKTEREKTIKESIEAADNFMAKLNNDDQQKFKRLLEAGRKVYHFQEDHGFYIDGGSTAYLHDVFMVAGRRLEKYGIIGKADEVFFLTFSEIEEIFNRLGRNKVAAIYHYKRLVPSLVKERKDTWEEVGKVKEAPLTIGNIPQKVEDPIMIKVFGMIDEVIKAGKVEEVRVMDSFTGYPGAPGVAEGVARVIMSYEDFPNLQPGEILVCPYTATAWTPLFPKIKAVVTDTGGMLTHAAITAREYGIPAVVGTWRATRSISTGDIIRVNGDAGIVEILKKAVKK